MKAIPELSEQIPHQEIASKTIFVHWLRWASAQPSLKFGEAKFILARKQSRAKLRCEWRFYLHSPRETLPISGTQSQYPAAPVVHVAVLFTMRQTGALARNKVRPLRTKVLRLLCRLRNSKQFKKQGHNPAFDGIRPQHCSVYIDSTGFCKIRDGFF